MYMEMHDAVKGGEGDEEGKLPRVLRSHMVDDKLQERTRSAILEGWKADGCDVHYPNIHETERDVHRSTKEPVVEGTDNLCNELYPLDCRNFPHVRLQLVPPSHCIPELQPRYSVVGIPCALRQRMHLGGSQDMLHLVVGSMNRCALGACFQQLESLGVEEDDGDPVESDLVLLDLVWTSAEEEM
mmetsp:Transcript_19497/g.48089  ORF Transcript_19497/g.48089 Transcript_19497/m.48089 type:complete len:185 (+) Transcript_19497:562-1116(+)